MWKAHLPSLSGVLKSNNSECINGKDKLGSSQKVFFLRSRNFFFIFKTYAETEQKEAQLSLKESVRDIILNLSRFTDFENYIRCSLESVIKVLYCA